MNPQNTHNTPEDYTHGTLPTPVAPAGRTTAARAAFPPLGAALPAYSPNSNPAGVGTLGAPVGKTTLDKPAKPRRGWKQWLKRTLITLLIIGLLGGCYVGIKLLMNTSKTLGGNVFGLLQTDKLAGEDKGRVNILLAGNSADDPGHSGGDLTDSIMILSIDTKHNTAFMVSVPRDLWVNVPGYGYSKINATYVYGKANKFSESGYPSGGMGALEKVIETNFDIDINYYALVNYTALRDAVNAVGGINVTIASTDSRGLYDPSRDWSGPRGTPLVKLTNGTHTLNGQQALNLARARGDTYGAYGYALGDFTRAANQRLMLTALKDKALSANVVSNPVKIGSLLDSFGDNVQTDFQTSEVRRLIDIAKKVPNSGITSVSLNNVDGKNLLASYRSSNGQSALIPAAGIDDFSAITAYLEQLMTPPATPTPTPSQ